MPFAFVVENISCFDPYLILSDFSNTSRLHREFLLLCDTQMGLWRTIWNGLERFGTLWNMLLRDKIACMWYSQPIIQMNKLITPFLQKPLRRIQQIAHPVKTAPGETEQPYKIILEKLESTPSHCFARYLGLLGIL